MVPGRSRDGDAEGNELFRLFSSVCCTNSLLLHHVLSLMPGEDQPCLHGANRLLRQAVNDAVTTVHCRLSNDLLQKDPLDVFPAARHVNVNLIQEPQVTLTDVSVFLRYLCGLGVVQKATHIEFVLPHAAVAAGAQAGLARCLSRCTALNALDISWGYPDVPLPQAEMPKQHCHFHGHGSTPDDRCASMQRQLAAISSSRSFLAPQSWPALGCLTSLSFALDIAQQGSALDSWLRPAMRTTSLAQLDIHCNSASQLEDAGCQSLTRLTILTSLSLSCTLAGSPAAQRKVASAVAGLTSLASLCLSGTFLQPPPPSTSPQAAAGSAAKPAWLQLSRLTALQLLGAPFRLRSIPTFPALQVLKLVDIVACGSLANLAHLTGLTALRAWGKNASWADDASGGEGARSGSTGGGASWGQGGAAVPAAWQVGLQVLHWCWRPQEAQLLVQLQALSQLSLQRPVVSPDLCCALADLPSLARLQLFEAVIADEADLRGPAAPALRLSLPRLRSLYCDAAAAIELLAYWTDVPGQLQLDLCLENDIVVQMDAGRCGAGWLAASLRHRNVNAREAVDDLDRQAVILELRGDSVVDMLLAAAAPVHSAATSQWESPGAMFILGADVSGSAFRRLFQAAPNLQSAHLRITAPLQADPALLGAVQPWHMHALLGLAVEAPFGMSLDKCSELGDRDVAFLAAAAPQLTSLLLDEAKQLSDRALHTLLACRSLRELALYDCPDVTPYGVGTTLAAAAALDELVVGGMPADPVRAELAGIGAEPGVQRPLAQRWQLEEVKDEDGEELCCTLLQ